MLAELFFGQPLHILMDFLAEGYTSFSFPGLCPNLLSLQLWSTTVSQAHLCWGSLPMIISFLSIRAHTFHFSTPYDGPFKVLEMSSESFVFGYGQT